MLPVGTTVSMAVAALPTPRNFSYRPEVSFGIHNRMPVRSARQSDTGEMVLDPALLPSALVDLLGFVSAYSFSVTLSSTESGWVLTSQTCEPASSETKSTSLPTMLAASASKLSSAISISDRS